LIISTNTAKTSQEFIMSDIHQCPTCNARAKKIIDPQNGEPRLKALQDDEAAGKILQLKKMLEKEKQRNEQLKARLAQLE
jgi:hypothetical protein